MRNLSIFPEVTSYRKLLLGMGLCVVGFILLANIYAIDAASVEDHGLFDIADIPDAQNAYPVVAYLYSDDFSVFSDDERQQVRRYLDFEEWSQSAVAKLLNDKSRIIADVTVAAAMPGFTMPSLHSVDDIYSLVPIRDVVQLFVLQFLFYCYEGNNPDALKSIATAAAFVEHNRSGVNAYLLNYVFSHAMQRLLLERLHWMASSDILDSRDYQAISAILHNMPAYKDDGFDRIVAAEYRLSSDFLREISGLSFADRWQSFRFSVESGFSDDSLMYDFVTTFFVYPYFQYNRVLSAMARDYRYVQLQTKNYCNRVNLQINHSTGSGFGDRLTPASYAMIKTSKAIFIPAYQGYFEQRCLHYVYVDALKAIVAMRHFRSVNGHYPADIAMLVPDYLDQMPIDYFTGEQLQYSVEKEWFFSAGNDYQLQGGSVQGYDWKNCSNNEACMQEPSLPLSY